MSKKVVRFAAMMFVLAAGAGLSSPSHALPANGQVIADAVSRSLIEVRFVCTWTCLQYKDGRYGPHCVKPSQNCSFTPDSRQLQMPSPPPQRTVPHAH